MSSHGSEGPDLSIWPLTFLQVYESADTVMSALLEKDDIFRKWFVSSEGWRQLGRYVIVPLYYHLRTSGYGAMIDNHLVGWLYLRGWHQVLYIETLATRQEWRQKGVGASLLRFAEQQAHILGREWMSLTVTLANTAAVTLYETEGYQRGHWRVMQHPPNMDVAGGAPDKVILRPVFGPPAESAYRIYSEQDQRAGDGWAAEAVVRLSSYDPYRQLGREWVVEVGGKPVGYLNLHQSAECLVLYLAAPSEWWGSPDILKAALLAIQEPEKHLPVCFRLASGGHHEAARPILAGMGFEEQPAVTTRMFKRLLKE